MAVPHHVVATPRGVYGLDAHFWSSVELDARKVLMVRPARTLSSDVAGCRVLPVRVGVEEQLRDLKALAAGDLRFAVRHARWKLGRLLAPLPEPRGGGEYVYASRIAGSLGLDEARPVGVSWLVVSVTLRGGSVEVSDGVYDWLAGNDRVFASSLREALGVRG
ncbi:hypothetical protein [Stetteria hydrogenophila]